MNYRIILLLALYFATSFATIPCDLTDERRQILSQQATLLFQQQGFTVAEGYINFKSICNWLVSETLTCLGQNPSSLYGKYELRSNVFLDTREPIWQLRQDEGLIFFGCTPPKSRYFGLQPYVVLTNWSLVFADLGDSINLLGINTSVGGDKPFSRQTLIITSPNTQTENIIRTTFEKLGISESTMNSLPIPDPSALHIDPLGIGIGYSVFSLLFRLSLCQNKSECEDYVNKSWAVIRVTPQTEYPNSPFQPKPLKHRGTGTNENWLRTSLSLLISKADEFFSKQSVLRTNSSLNPLNLEGYVCIDQLTDCLGDTRDALYMDGNEPLLPPRKFHLPKSPESFYLTTEPGDFIVVIGVIHSKTNKAIYSNIAVYNVEAEMGVGAVIDDDLEGSANRFVPNDPYREYLYVQVFARDNNCLEEGCFSVPTEFPGVPLDKPLTFVERAYVEPKTGVGPNGKELLRPTVLHYKSI